jgi:hypothetical protein
VGKGLEIWWRRVWRLVVEGSGELLGRVWRFVGGKGLEFLRERAGNLRERV